MIVGTIFIFGRIANALFDISASYSFTYTTYVKLFGFVVGVLDELVYVEIPIRRSLEIDSVCKSCKLIIGSSEFVANLIIFGVENFDIILCIDWLSANYIAVNYTER